MNDEFRGFYEEERKIIAEQHYARFNNDQEKLMKANKEHNEFMQRITSRGPFFYELYRLYRSCISNNNKYINISSYDKKLISIFRRYGIEKFTFCCRNEEMSYEDAACAMENFVTNSGCTIEGMTAVNMPSKYSRNKKSVPGFILKIN